MEDSARRSQEIRSQRRRKNRRQDALLNFVSTFLALSTVLLGLWFGLIYINPWNPANPFPPPPRSAAPAKVMVTPTRPAATATTAPPIAGLTPTPTAGPSPIPTLLPPQVPTPVPTGTAAAALPGTRTVPTATRAGYIYPYMLQGPPAGIPATMFSPDLGCRWLGIAGQAFDRQSRPAAGLRVWLNGTFNGAQVDINTLTGTAPRYGQAGYEFTLADRPLASKSLLYVRLMDQEDRQASERVQIETFEDCGKNLIIVNFVQVK